ncbi:MAG: hypothetical protein ACMUIL_11950 [bacterium]
MKLKGWQAAVVLAVLVGLVGIRFMTFQDKTDDENLMRDLEMQLKSDYLPEETERLRAAVDSGDMDRISKVAESVTGAKPKIESVQISSPLLDFSTPRDVVVRVVYSLAEGTRTRDRKMLYFLYSHGSIGNTWSYQYETTAVRYYLNFK